MSLTTNTARLCGHKWLLLPLAALALAPPVTMQTLTQPHKLPYPWQLKSCDYTWDCVDLFGFPLPHSKCIDNLCKCEHGYDLDLHGKKCVKNKECLFNFDCGTESNAYCHQSRCRCKLGYVRKGDEEDCHLKKCIDNVECYLWSNTKCDIFGECACKEGYSKGWDSETCLKVNTVGYSYNFLAQNVFTIVIISNFLLWLSIFIFILQYVKKRRLAAVAAASSGSSMRRTLPPGMPPPPPAYDNIGFDPVGFPPPPPDTPTDVEKAAAAAASSSLPPPVVSIIDVPGNEPPQQQPQSSSTQAVPSYHASQVRLDQSVSHISQ